MPTPRLSPQHTALLVIDLQEKLLPHIHNAERVVTQSAKLIEGFKILGLPILATEQYRKGLGPTVAEIAGRLPRMGEGAGGTPAAGTDAIAFEKLKFSACIEPVRESLQRQGVRVVLVCGVEAHVCVLQTCLDLIDSGYTTALALDAIGSRRIEDQQVAIARLTQSGVIPTTVESALLELVHEAGGARFKAILPLIK